MQSHTRGHMHTGTHTHTLPPTLLFSLWQLGCCREQRSHWPCALQQAFWLAVGPAATMPDERTHLCVCVLQWQQISNQNARPFQCLPLLTFVSSLLVNFHFILLDLFHTVTHDYQKVMWLSMSISDAAPVNLWGQRTWLNGHKSTSNSCHT